MFNKTKGRLITSGILILFYALFRVLYAPFENLVRASAGVGQLSNDPLEVGTSLAFSQYNVPVLIANVVLVFLLAVVWLTLLTKRRNPVASVLLALVILAPLAAGCMPFKGTTPVVIAPNQTAFLLPSQGDTTDQAKFDSIDYLKNNQVAAKVVEISFRQHKIGRMSWDVDFIPNQILVLVDRKPASRQWTYSKDTGTGGANQAIALESRESIGFYHGVVVNAVIEEADAAKFLYYYGGAGVAGDVKTTGIQLSVGLDQVMDTFVRTWVADQLYAEFKALPLEEAQIEAGNIFARVQDRAKANFVKYGITILDLGGIEGLIYDTQAVQDTIDQKFQVAAQATSQAISNRRNIDQANAQATVTVMQAQAEAQAYQVTGEQLAQYPSLVNKMLAEKSTGQVPQVLVMQNSNDGISTMPFPFWFYYPPTQTAPAADASPVPTSAGPGK